MSAARIAVYSPIRLYAEGIGECLRARGAFAEVRNFATADEAIECGRRGLVDVLIYDSMELRIRDFRAACAVPGVRVVALLFLREEHQVLELLEAGAVACIGRGATMERVLDVASRSAAGEVVLSPHMTTQLLGAVRRRATRPDAPGLADDGCFARLTPRELQVAHELADGLTNKEIARRLSIGVSTVKNHVHNLLEKLEVPRRGHVGALLRRHPHWGRRSKDLDPARAEVQLRSPSEVDRLTDSA